MANGGVMSGAAVVVAEAGLAEASDNRFGQCLAPEDTNVVNPQGIPITETKPQYKNRHTYVQTKKAS